MNKFIPEILAALKNQSRLYKRDAVVTYSKSGFEFISLLYKHGYISSFKRVSNKIVVYLKYHGKTPIISNVELYSTPGRHLSIKYNALVRQHSLNDGVVLSTENGYIMLLDAYQIGVGGQIICKII